MLRALLLSLLVLAVPARAGTECSEKPLAPNTVAAAMNLAQATREALDASGAQVVLIARAGQDLSRYGLRYSHLGFAWRDHPKGRWVIRHELNDCGTATSALYDDGLANFFLDDMFEYQALLLIPNSADQERLAATLASGVPARLHAPAYNMLSYPFSTRFQNSNQWVLETYAASQSDRSIPVRDREQAQAWLRLAGYKPITVEIPAVVRLGARVSRANVTFEDQPFDRRMAGKIDTVTVDSVVRFVRERDQLSREQTVRAQ
ncbi:DUF2145 domain-containing protein [Pseudoduganella sp. GCM10020061]|uniref:DUF2145 domain-containing protein n=1 Tax=Pseudoduganella sp. GCM10020061 TaxID=3317345 RepID=UPI00362705B0